MMIDSHVHIGGSEKTERSWDFESYAVHMNKHGIGRAVVMPNVSNITKASVLNHTLLSEYRSLMPRDTAQFLIFLLIDPTDTEEILTPDIAYGFKFHPSIYQVRVSDTRLAKYIWAARDKNWPILVHCGRDPVSHIGYLITVAKTWPNVNFIAAHLGGNAGDLIENALTLIAESKAKNIYLDTSNGKLPWLIEQAVSKLGYHRIIFGSDEPYADLRVAKYLIDLANITTKAKEAIFYENIQGLIRPH